MIEITLKHFYRKPLKVRELIITSFDDGIGLEMVISDVHSIHMPKLYFNKTVVPKQTEESK